LRWRHPERGLLLPDDFLREAERTGLVVPIGDWALREAARQARTWCDLQPGLRLTISVNVSARQLAARTLLGSFEAALAATGLAADRLCVEVTENVFFGGSEDVALVLAELKRRGFHVHVDDFGTGYSPLGILHRFPVDVLKIDRSFVAGLGRERQSAAIVRAIVSLAQSLDMTVIAEGIEQGEQLRVLESMGCDAGQGFLLGEPVDSAGAAAVVKRAVVTPDLSRR
jgi:EAL domain-containing protein (putative c-di-GMP-specific phosphodiesterase class I)